MMPLLRGREKSASEVFFTVPMLVAMKTNLPSSIVLDREHGA